MAAQNLSKPPQLSVVFDATPDGIQQEAEAIVSRTRRTWDDIVSKVAVKEATFENVVAPIALDENSRMGRQRVLRFYASTSPSPDVRKASSEAATLFNGADVDLYSRHDMFLLVDHVWQYLDQQGQQLDGQSKYYLEKLCRRFRHTGSGIVGDDARAAFNTKLKRSKQLIQDCNKTLREDKNGVWLTPEELAGVPASLVKSLAQGQSEHEGTLLLPTKPSSSLSAISNAKKESTRRRIHYAVQNRARINVPLFRELVLLRDETARMLGYNNHYALKTSEKMMETPEAVISLLSELRDSVDDLAQKDAQEMLEVKQAEDPADVENGDAVFFWDSSYLKGRLAESAGVSRELTQEYFELETTIAKLLDMFEHMFGVRFIRTDLSGQECVEQNLTWHDDVIMYQVWNVDGTYSGPEAFLGYGYLDLFPRDGKHTHAGHYLLAPSYRKSDGARFYPSSALVMNYSKTPNQPVLLPLDGVRKLFHEIGHMVHSLHTRVTYAALHSVDRDFVEAPSLMFEQFFWDERYVKAISHHYSHIDRWRPVWLDNAASQGRSPDNVPLQLSDEVVSSLVKSSAKTNRTTQLKEIFFTTYDMLVHMPESHQALEEMNLSEQFNKTRTATYHIHGGEAIGDPDGWEWAHGQTIFRNILNDYDAGYYSYVLGRLFALDIYETGFSKDPMDKAAGRRYRDVVLSVGGSQPEMKTLVEFLGRPPSTAPYLAWLGAS